MTAKVTDLAIRNAKPRAKKYKLTAGRGLTLIVMPDGAKYWRLRYRYAAKAKEISLGRPYPELSLRDAQDEATRMRALLADGSDPAEQRLQKKLEQKRRAIATIGDAANAWVEFRSRSWAERTKEQVREYLDKDLLPALGKRSLSAVTTRELADFSGAIHERGAPDVAKKMRQWLTHIFRYARAEGCTTNDPTRDLHALVLPTGSASNYPHLQLNELPELLRKLHSFDASPIVKGAAILSLWSANRPGVTRTLRWDELDLESGNWIIEKGREGMKRGYSHVTPLPTQAVAMLREIHQITGTFDHVFIGRNDPRKSLSDGAVNALLKRIGFRGRQTAHGFRHLISTALNELGYERDWIERQLAHGDPDKTRDIYNKAKYLEERRKMMQAWADYLEGLCLDNTTRTSAKESA